MKCQTMITTHRIWACGGREETHVCGEKATHVCRGRTVKERAGPPMYLCKDCRVRFLALNPEYKKYVVPLKKRKKKLTVIVGDVE